MALTIVSTPIGNEADITAHAIDAIKNAELVIGEEKKPTLKLLKQLSLTGRPVELLNEHSDEEDLQFLLSQCKEKNVALVSDCGTPGFCDPGANLVKLCYQQKIPVTVAPGASSLMAFLALTGERLDQFLFRGFLPANNEKREQAWSHLKRERLPIIIMDTPYRLTKTLDECRSHWPKKTCILGYRLTYEDQKVLRGPADELYQQMQGQKGAFILLLL